MKPSLVVFSACPACKSKRELRVELQDGTEVLEGSLPCRGCGGTNRIRGGGARPTRRRREPEDAG